MAFSTGTATINFGADPGSNEASVAVTGQTGILSNSKVEAFVMADDTTSDHTANDHRYLPQFVSFTCSNPTAGIGFTIYGRSIHKMTGTYQLRFVWSD
jgi:hypothetical protein